MEMQNKRQPKLVMEVRASDFHKTGADSQFIILKMKSGEYKTGVQKQNENISFRSSKRRVVTDGVGGIPQEDLNKIIAFFIVLYGLMAAIFILLSAANSSFSDFGLLWIYFAIFMVTATGIVYKSVLQYQRTQEALAMKEAQKSAAANPM